MSSRGDLTRFETGSRRRVLAIGRADMTTTAMTYLRATKITVVTKTQLLRALPTTPITAAEVAQAEEEPS